MEEGETGIRWEIQLHLRETRAPVLPESRQLKQRNKGPIGRRLQRYLANKWITWIVRPVPVRKASAEPSSNVSISAAADGRVAGAAGREVAGVDAEGNLRREGIHQPLHVPTPFLQSLLARIY
jgi:hypothetical protein